MPERPGSPPRRRAAALHYEPGERAPVLTATGAGHIAERIIESARAAGVPVREDPALVQALAGLQLGAEVPEPLWRAVAETLAWAYRLQSADPARGA
ncbi:MAG TPA: EscU/YscU/HrcU family type III secretion system export apparatus switch protein [Solirubrobacteraceae bacterium]|nr:EscU/YscU/HrcU family type III secretion system export apparatus switch protein [Solirubrobacteraceae bacterium]